MKDPIKKQLNALRQEDPQADYADRRESDRMLAETYFVPNAGQTRARPRYLRLCYAAVSLALCAVIAVSAVLLVRGQGDDNRYADTFAYEDNLSLDQLNQRLSAVTLAVPAGYTLAASMLATGKESGEVFFVRVHLQSGDGNTSEITVVCAVEQIDRVPKYAAFENLPDSAEIGGRTYAYRENSAAAVILLRYELNGCTVLGDIAADSVGAAVDWIGQAIG